MRHDTDSEAEPLPLTCKSIPTDALHAPRTADSRLLVHGKLAGEELRRSGKPHTFAIGGALSLALVAPPHRLSQPTCTHSSRTALFEITDSADFHGWLSKQGGQWPYSWQMRYFTFIGDTLVLRYYGASNKKNLNNGVTFELRGESVVIGVREHSPSPAFALDVMAMTMGSRVVEKGDRQRVVIVQVYSAGPNR